MAADSSQQSHKSRLEMAHFARYEDKKASHIVDMLFQELQLCIMEWLTEWMMRKWPISFGSHKGEWVLIQANTDELHEQDVPRTDSERHRR